MLEAAETPEVVQRALAAQLAELQKLKASREDLDRANARVATLVTDARLRNDSIHALLDDLEGALQKEKKGQEALLVEARARRDAGRAGPSRRREGRCPARRRPWSRAGRRCGRGSPPSRAG